MHPFIDQNLFTLSMGYTKKRILADKIRLAKNLIPTL